MTNHDEPEPDDKDLYKVVERYTWRDFKGTIFTLSLLTIFVLILVYISFLIMPDSGKKPLLVIVAMMCALLFGWVVASLVSPLTSTEDSQFQRILRTLAGVVSGFTLGKIGSIIDFLKESIPSPTADSIEINLLVLAPSACFLIGLISAFVLRSAFISLETNRRELLRRRLYERQAAAGPGPGGA